MTTESTSSTAQASMASVRRSFSTCTSRAETGSSSLATAATSSRSRLEAGNVDRGGAGEDIALLCHLGSGCARAIEPDLEDGSPPATDTDELLRAVTGIGLLFPVQPATTPLANPLDHDALPPDRYLETGGTCERSTDQAARSRRICSYVAWSISPAAYRRRSMASGWSASSARGAADD